MKLSDIFNHFARESTRLFPQVKGSLLILDANEAKAYGREELDPKKVRASSKSLDSFIKKRLADKNRQTYADWGNSLRLSFILYDEHIKKTERSAVPEKTEREILFILDHELAHIVIPMPKLVGESQQYAYALQESIADAYAMIRHYQRYGTESTHKSVMIDPWARAGALTLNEDTEHFSTLVLEEIIRRKDTIDFKALDTRQTVELARRFAVTYTPPASVVNGLFEKLQPVQKAFLKDPKSDAWLKTLARITLDPHNDPATFKICRNILTGYLEGRQDMDGMAVKAEGPYWDNLRKQLQEAGQRFEREDILFNIPRQLPPKAA